MSKKLFVVTIAAAYLLAPARVSAHVTLDRNEAPADSSIPAGPSVTQWSPSLATSALVVGSYSVGGTSTRPSLRRTPNNSPLRNPVRKRPTTGPVERVYPPGYSSWWWTVMVSAKTNPSSCLVVPMRHSAVRSTA